MSSSLIAAIRDSGCADVLARWLPDLVAAGFRRVTVFHSVPQGRSGELDQLRPALDRLNLMTSLLGVETDLALKRGDASAWLLAMAELRHTDVIVLRRRGAGALLDVLAEWSRVPVIALPDARPPEPARGLARPALVAGYREEVVLAVARRVIREPVVIVAAHAHHALPEGTGAVISGPVSAGTPAAELLDGARCPVLLVTDRALRVAAPSNQTRDSAASVSEP